MLFVFPFPTFSQFPGSCRMPYWIFSNTTAYHCRLRQHSQSLLFYDCFLSLLQGTTGSSVTHLRGKMSLENTADQRLSSDLYLAQLVNNLEQRLSSEVNISINPEIHSALRTPQVHYCIGKSPKCVTISSQINPVHDVPKYFFQNPFQYYRTPTPGSSKWPLSLGFPTELSHSFVFYPTILTA